MEIYGNWRDAASTMATYEVLRLHTRSTRQRDVGTLEYLEYIDAMHKVGVLRPELNQVGKDKFIQEAIKNNLVPSKEEKGTEHVALITELAEVYARKLGTKPPESSNL